MITAEPAKTLLELYRFCKSTIADFRLSDSARSLAKDSLIATTNRHVSDVKESIIRSAKLIAINNKPTLSVKTQIGN